MVVRLLVKQIASEVRVLGLSIVPLLSGSILILLSLSFLCKGGLILYLPHVLGLYED